MSKLIPGIHNYCDRWCERCPFSSRCAVYAQEHKLSPEEKDDYNRQFWDRFSQNLHRAVHVLEEMMKKHGIVPEPLTEEDKQQNALNDLMTEAHPLIVLSRSYIKEADDCLNESEENKEPEAQLRESMEVIEWYKYFITAKLLRALSAKNTRFEWEEEEEGLPGYNGSAKVALIAIDRSMQAWSVLYDRNKSDQLLNLLATLDRLKKMTLTEFPQAMEFHRPGFDE
jgi:hypothetical protein